MNIQWRQWLYSVSSWGASIKVVHFLGKDYFFQRKQDIAPVPYRDAGQQPINTRKIVFRCEHNNYRCNPKYIAEEILRRKLPWELVWIVDKDILRCIKDIPSSIRLERIETPEAIRECDTAKVIIDNAWRSFLLQRGVMKRPEQVYIQTWRGSYGIKKFLLAQHNYGMKAWTQASLDIKQMDYFLSNSGWETRFYQRAFRCPKNRILEFGHPRNDILFRREEYNEVRNKVTRRLGISDHVRILLYAPTRHDERARSAYSLDVPRVLGACASRWGGEWVCAARLTPKGVREHYLLETPDIVLVHNYADMQELLVASDVCISDYSSCIFDFLHTGRPAFIFAPDHVRFERTRGLYYPLANTPLPFAATNEQLLENIQEFDAVNFANKVHDFLAEKGSIEDGHASERIVDFLEVIIGK